MDRRAVVVRHSPVEPLGASFTSILEKHGLQPDELPLFEHAPAFDRFPTPDLKGTRTVIILGGPMSVNDGHPALEEEQRFIRSAIAEDIPVFGVCLGAQLMSAALGGRVEPTGGFQFGLRKIDITLEGCVDAVFGKIKVPLAPTLHGDCFSIPDGAVPLAHGYMLCKDGSFRKINMAYRYRSSYGFQFEPQLTFEEMVIWNKELYDDYKLMGDRFDPAQESERTLREFTRYAPLYEAQMHDLFAAFLDQAL